MALTELGFNRPTYDDILEQQEARAKTLFGETIDTSEQTALGKYIRINVADLDTLYQTLEGVYFARFPNTATGINLDRLCPFVGITRNSATYARHQITITGTVGATIEGGFEVSNENQSVVFHLIDDYVIGNDGTVTAYVDCNETGTIGNISPLSINTIVNPSADVDSIIGVSLVNIGEEKESDTALRHRFNEAVAGTGSGTPEAIKGAIMRINGVDGCTIVENTTDTTVDGIPPHSFKCFVLSDETSVTDQLIGEAIFSKKPLGITSSGAVSVDVQDESGNIHKIAFDRTAKKNVYIKIMLTKNNYFEENGIDTIKNNLVNYFSELTNGDDVYLSALYSCINITGVVNVYSLELSTDGATFTQDNIICGENEIARTSASMITVVTE